MSDFAKIKKQSYILNILSIILSITLLSGVILITKKYFFRKELTHNILSISPETRAYLKKLNQDVDLIIINSGSDDYYAKEILQMISQLTREYGLATAKNEQYKIHPTEINPFKNAKLFAEIKSKIGTINDYSIILRSRDRIRQLTIHELFITENNEGYMIP